MSANRKQMQEGGTSFPRPVPVLTGDDLSDFDLGPATGPTS
jgi:hypothetical protein